MDLDDEKAAEEGGGEGRREGGEGGPAFPRGMRLATTEGA